MVGLGEVIASSFSGKFLVGWFLSYRMFQYLNYKSLESILLTYPQASTKLRLIAPRFVTNDRCGEMLPYPIFSKYEKQGLRIATEVVNLADPIHRQASGFEYWKNVIPKTFSHNITETITHVPIPSHTMDFYPALYHTVFYDALVQLNQFGGIYSDLSWMHLKPIPGIDILEQGKSVSGYVTKIICDEQELPPELMRAFKRPPFYCKASSLMIFSKHHPVLQCMINKYSQTDFLQCLEEDIQAQGAFCLEKHMRECFTADPNAVNVLTHPITSSSSSLIDFEMCYKEVKKHSANDLRFTSAKKSDNAAPQINVPLMPPDCKTITFDNMSKLIYSKSPSDATDYKVGEDQAVLWMNSAGYSTQWIVPKENSLLATIIQKHNNALRQAYQSRTDSNVDLVGYNPLPCSPYKLNPRIIAESRRDISDNSQTAGHGDYVNVIEHSLRAQEDRANMSCVLNYVLPGFMKAASTYIYGTIDNHPWVVRALRGFDYKEAGCYSSEFMGGDTIPQNTSGSHNALMKQSDRMLCYPFLEPGLDRVAYGDGSIVYAPRKDIIHHLLRDNPHLKVLFSVRDPVERAVSIHRFDYGSLKTLNFPNINECIMSALNLKIYQYWHGLAVRTIKKGQSPLDKEQAREKLADKFMTDISKMFKLIPNRMRCFRIIHDSLYFPQIFHWFKASKVENIRVLDVQRLQTSRLTQEEKLDALSNTPIVHDTNLRRLFLTSKIPDVPLGRYENSSAIFHPQGSNQKLHPQGSNQKLHPHHPKEGQNHHHSNQRLLAENKLVTVDRKYLLYQWNAIYRFLGLPAVVELHEADKHETTAHEIPQEYLLNATVKERLIQFFEPFNVALIEFMDDVGNKVYE